MTASAVYLPSLLEACQRVYDAWDTYQHERIDTPSADLVSQEVIDLYHLAGPPDDIGEKLVSLGGLGIKTIATTLYSVIDKKGMLQEIGSRLITRFRN